jgi:hypothetical protein
MMAAMMITVIMSTWGRHPLVRDVFPGLPLPFELDFTLFVDMAASCLGECAFSLRAFPCELDFSVFLAKVPPESLDMNNLE